MLLELLVSLETIKDIMSWYETLEATVNCLIEAKWVFGFDTNVFSLIEGRVELVEVFLDQFIVFITDFTKLSGCVSHEEMVEVLLVREGALDVVSHKLHSP
jgi:hypothetical protein